MFTTPQGMALDTFWLQNRDDNALAASGALAKLTVQIERAFAGEMSRSEPEAERTFVPARTKVFTVPPRVIIDNQASATHTVIEINGRDRPGFLYRVTRALYDLSLQVSSAKISTFGERAVDVFYVKDGFGMKVSHESRIAADPRAPAGRDPRGGCGQGGRAGHAPGGRVDNPTLGTTGR